MAKAIARIYEGDTDRAVGVGFWVFPGYLLTCAHVVNQALGWEDGAQGLPEGFIMLDFPDLQHRQRLKGRVVHWLPIDSNWEGDIAVLEVEMPAVEPMLLGQPTGQPLSVSGFPGEYNVLPILDDVKIAAGADLDRGLVQLNTLTGRIQKGFSGSPVWEVQSGTVVGMVTLSDQDSGAGWMVPAQILSQQLSETVLSNIARFIQIEGVSDRCITDLLNILKGESYDFDSIWAVAVSVLPESIEENSMAAIRSFRDQAVDSNFFKSLKFLKFFLADYPDKFIDFANVIDRVEGSDSWVQELKSELAKWKQEYFPVQNVAARDLTVSIEPSAHLMIVLAEVKHNTRKKARFRLSASLLCLSSMRKREYPIDLDGSEGDDSQTHAWKDLPDQVRLLTIAASAKLKKDSSPGAPLTIEFFLPIQYLCEPIDQWEIRDSLSSIRLGKKYRVIVRSYDRAIDYDLQGELNDSSNRMKALLENQTNLDAVLPEIYHCAEISGLNSFAVALRENVGVKITCPLPKQKTDVLVEILRSGVPIAFWTRCDNCVREESYRGIRQFLTIELLKNPSELLRRVQNERTRALDYPGTSTMRWARHLTVLWDDADRIPSFLDAYPEGGSR
jgi:vWA-MoxR associated protein C-terminal domain/Trypsin-like peptidase domain